MEIDIIHILVLFYLLAKQLLINRELTGFQYLHTATFKNERIHYRTMYVI